MEVTKMTTQQQNDLLKTMIENSYLNCDGIIWMSINKNHKDYEKIKAMILECESNEISN